MACSVAERLFAVETVGVRIVWDATIKVSETAGVGVAFFYSEMRIIRVILVTLFLFYTIKQILIANYLDL